jgi:hypothetical protein
MKLGQLTRVGTLLLLSTLLVTGCSSGAKKDQSSSSPDPSNSPTDTESQKPIVIPKLDYNDKIVLAKDALELEFLTIALDSCEKAQKDGFSVTSGYSVSYFRPAAEGIFPYWPFDEVTVKNGVVGPGAYQNYYPSLLDPCDLELGGRLWSRQIDDVGLEHKVDKLADNSYSWSQHHGGYHMDETVYQVSNGLITRYGPYNNMDAVVGYGPFTPEQSAYFDKVNE